MCNRELEYRPFAIGNAKLVNFPLKGAGSRNVCRSLRGI